MEDQQSRPQVQQRTVTEDAGRRLDNYLISQLPGIPRSRIYRMIRKGEVRINGSRCKPNTHLVFGDSVRIPPVRTPLKSPQTSVSDRLKTLLRNAILYQDDDVLVIDKPSGLAVHGGSGVRVGIAEVIGEVFEQPGMQLAHRLDRHTSGCLVITKTKASMRVYHDLFRRNALKKVYTLFVEGHWPEGLTHIDASLERYLLESGERRVRVSAKGQPSHTQFEVVRACARASWLTAEPTTGRTHQIRVHAKSAGHAILGDEKYASGTFEPSPERLMLHASSIELPDIGAIEAPLPTIFNHLWERLNLAD